MVINWGIVRTKSRQDAKIGRYNQTVRYDFLAQFTFDSIVAVRDVETEWL